MQAFKCPNCGISTWGNLKYCPECGQSLEKKCIDCGYSVRHMYGDKYKFCPKCGEKMDYLKK
ncbi:MAG: zinc ribbon domain-containing protein [Victivallales bacterium]|nr:zinc ribbon domain-containing protein [Victivallales bacterium]